MRSLLFACLAALPYSPPILFCGEQERPPAAEEAARQDAPRRRTAGRRLYPIIIYCGDAVGLSVSLENQRRRGEQRQDIVFDIMVENTGEKAFTFCGIKDPGALAHSFFSLDGKLLESTSSTLDFRDFSRALSEIRLLPGEKALYLESVTAPVTDKSLLERPLLYQLWLYSGNDGVAPQHIYISPPFFLDRSALPPREVKEDTPPAVPGT